MTDDPKPLSPRHARFVAEYLTDLNATQAYIRAGYKPGGAQVNSSKLLRNPQVKAAIAEGQMRVAESLQISAEQIAAEYAKIARANIDDFIAVDADNRIRIDLSKASRAQRAGLVELTVTDHGEGKPQRVKIKMGKLQALAALTRHIGVLVARPEAGLAAEDRQRMEAQAAAHEEMRARMNEERRRLKDELRRTREALAAAEARLKVPGIENPNPSIYPLSRQPDEPSEPETPCIVVPHGREDVEGKPCADADGRQQGPIAQHSQAERQTRFAGHPAHAAEAVFQKRIAPGFSLAAPPPNQIGLSKPYQSARPEAVGAG